MMPRGLPALAVGAFGFGGVFAVCSCIAPVLSSPAGALPALVGLGLAPWSGGLDRSAAADPAMREREVPQPSP